MKLSELIGEEVDPDPEIKGLAVDSRLVREGYLFAAIAGASLDGAAFIDEACARGAAAILAAPGAAKSVKAPVVEDPEPRMRLAAIAARFFPRQPEFIAGVTGTNGKTSTVRFAAQLWTLLGHRAGSMGTLGAIGPSFFRAIGHTTPDPITLHQTLDLMSDAGVDKLAMEVSSHGLDQHRADSVRFSAAAFTNLTQDHLDFHGSFAAYGAAKKRLFEQLLPLTGFAVVNADGEGAEEILVALRAREIRTLTTGANGEDIRLLAARPHNAGLEIDVRIGGSAPFFQHTVNLSLVGAFQAENALLALGIVIGGGAPADQVLPLLDRLEGAPGRMQFVSDVGGASVYVDCAHTPDAVATALRAIRPHARGRVIAIIGAGGDRDRAKRPLMGAAAARGADVIIVTDDNPRSEDPSVIRAAVLSGCPGATEIGDRAAAIDYGVGLLRPGDALIIAGKGHENGQIVGDRVLPFSDYEVAAKAARAHTGGLA